MKAILEFDTTDPEELKKFKTAAKADQYQCFVNEFRHYMYNLQQGYERVNDTPFEFKQYVSKNSNEDGSEKTYLDGAMDMLSFLEHEYNEDLTNYQLDVTE